MNDDPIVLKGVKVHNLKNVDLSLNKGELIVFTGVSGSGKSSLAFDTIYVEGQRRYIEALPHQSRHYLSELPKPNAEKISGIAPTIAIEQKLSTKTPRSTVGTLTGIYDFLRVLFARIAVPYCPISQKPVLVQSKEKIIGELKELAEGSQWFFLAPFAKGKKGEFREEFAELLSRGFTRLLIDKTVVDLSEVTALNPKTAHDIDLIVDRLEVSPANHSRMAESASLALDLGKGFFRIASLDLKEERSFSQHAYSQESGQSYGPLEPSDFSFNHPKGMCPHCQGLGITSEFDIEKVIDPELSIAEDCCKIASSYQTVRFGNIYRNLANIYDFKIDKPWKKLSSKAQKIFLYGTDDQWTKMLFIHPVKKTRWTEFVKWRGVLHEAQERLRAATSESYKKKFSEWMTETVCPICLGSRIKPYPSAAKLFGKTLYEITSLPLEEAARFFSSFSCTPVERQISEELLKEIQERLKFLNQVGLSYLSLSRLSPSLSGGESQRVRLAAQIGAGLVGVVYVLDEPSIGLHPQDHNKLIDTLLHLKEMGNTVLVVEHDADTMQAADTIIDVGPGAGKQGGRILSASTYEAILQNPESITGAYLSGRCEVFPKKKLRSPSKEQIKIIGAQHHNLQSIDVTIPLGIFVCVTGLSGSGKSSLILDTLFPFLANQLHHAQHKVGKYRSIEGIEWIDKVISVDQSPIGRTPRSNPATYIKLFDEIRDLFAKLPESKLRGFDVGHFSFNVAKGSCSYCQGLGQVQMDMDFLEDVWVECPQCLGKRFDPEVLAVTFRGHTITNVLDMDVASALQLFDHIPSIRKKLQVLSDAGLDYLSLGQSSTTLSGGEAQRVKLAKELVRPSSGRTLYIFDEPTTGLHFHDIHKLLQTLHTLVDQGNTVLVIEHNLDLIRSADWLIDLGPGAGIHGGKLLAEGPPKEIIKKNTPTGKALKASLGTSDTTSRTLSKKCQEIVIQNATQNNLKNLSLKVPHGKLTIFTGPSGSGKSSLALDTLYAEGQRRYTETLPPYARAQVKQLPKPKVDRIEGLLPSIALEQKTGGLNPRSTVGTMSEVYDWLRILMAHLGIAYCPDTKEKIEQISKEFVLQKLMTTSLDQKLHILAPFEAPSSRPFSEVVESLKQDGFVRIRLNHTFYELDDPIPFESHRKNQLELVIDRLVCTPKNELRLLEALQKTVDRTRGIVRITDEKQEYFFNLTFAVPSTGVSYPPITPQTFSFNHEEGMCLDCQGLGIIFGAHFEGQPTLLRRTVFSLLQTLCKEKLSFQAETVFERVFHKLKIPLTQKMKELSDRERNILFHGGDEVQLKKGLFVKFRGIESTIAILAKRALAKFKEPLLPYLQGARCPSCRGSRLNPLASHVKINGWTIQDLCDLSLAQTRDILSQIKLTKEHLFLQETLDKLLLLLDFLLSVGLSYLSLSRSAPTLSGGELQRIRLAKQIGSGLTSCLYVLDEPTIGLHPHNSDLLLGALRRLIALGNTLVLVEHDLQIIQEADYLFDLGPKAGHLGGQITAEGPPEALKKNPSSLTGAYLAGRKKIPIPSKRRPFIEGISIENATLHNLKGVSVSFPKAAITAISGVSGSGKSTLIRHLLKPAAELACHSRKKNKSIQYCDATITGLEGFEKVITIDQSPIGQSPRADVSTYTDIMPLIRAHFAALPLSLAKGLQPRHFSPNHLKGMCRTCWGLGYKTVSLQFLPSVQIPCEGCSGYRLNPISLQVHYRDKHLGQILQMDISQAKEHFAAIPRIAKRLALIESVGLAYLPLGREIASLSGGEAQRLRLCKELAKRETGKTLYLIDEPTIGLHSEDVFLLLPIFQRLVEKKNTLILIEHNLDVLMQADYLIDLGPGAGEEGGRVMAKGTPEEVSLSPNSLTAPYLKKLIQKK